MCPGAVFSVMPGFTLGEPQPTTDFTGSLVTDGERPFGRRASNRTVILPVKITAPVNDWSVLAGARELLMQLADQQFFNLTWTRRASPEDTSTFPIVFSCFRNQPVTIQYGGYDTFELHPVQLVTLTFGALPYGKSDTAQQIAFASPVAAINAPSPPPAPVVIDTFTTINNPQCVQSPVHVIGPVSCYWDPLLPPASSPDGAGIAFTYSATLTAPVNLAGLAGLSMWVGLGSRYRYNLDRDGRTAVTAAVTLTDNEGNTLPVTGRLRMPSSPDPANPVFTLFTMPLPQTRLVQASTVFNYASVVSYTLTLRNRAVRPGYPAGELKYACCYVDTLSAVPPSAIPVIPSSRGTIYQLNGVLGTIHCQAALSFQQGPAPGTPVVLSTPGAGLYTVPAGTSYLSVSATGAGGAGASETAAGAGGGGGGGENATEPLFPATPGQQIPYSIGAGGTSGAAPVNGGATVFGSGTGLTVVANGGMSAAENSSAGAAGGSGSINTQHFSGGPGRTASGVVGGGGGSSAGPAAPGLTPTGTAAVTLSGSGNWTCPAGVTQVTAFATGGGGGGASGASFENGAGGGGGQSAQQTFAVVPGTQYPYQIGNGGAGGSSSGGVAGSGGSPTTFTVAGVTLTAAGGAGGQPGYWGSGYGGAGGSGGSAPVSYPGGTGGSPYPYSGGGGSSAGTSNAGNPGTGYGGGGTAPSGGGAGGAGSGSGAGAGHAGSAPGGGGGGSYETGYAGGAGAAGTLILSYPGGAPTSNGAIAPAGGGAGGAGGASANTAGSAGANPGGGGGGAYSTTAPADAGGAGGAGQLVITPFAPPQFRTLIAHRPSPGCPIELNPLVAIGGVIPGGTEFPVASMFATRPARFNGTYNVIAVAETWNNPTAARTVSITVKQYEYPGGASYLTSTAPVTITPSSQVTNGIVICGPVTLPFKAIPSDNTNAYFTVLINDSNGSDTWLDVLLLDTQGQMAAINEAAAGYYTYYLDMPDPIYDLGLVLGSQGGRADAISVSDVALLSGGPLTLEPGLNMLLAYCIEGSPNVSVSYFPAYYSDRLWL
jgi:hypothetical protein